MGGIEFTVGVVLASVPIAIELFEQYTKLSETTSTFRHHYKEINKLRSIIGTQRTIFRCNALDLLSAVTDDQDRIRSWISVTRPGRSSGVDTCNPLGEWELSELCRNRADSLKESFQSCEEIAGQIVSVLDTILKEVSTIIKAVEKTADTDEMSARDRFTQLKIRVKFAVRKTDLYTMIDELRDFNNDFNTMAAQIVRSLVEAKKKSTPGPAVQGIQLRGAVNNINVLEQYRRIRLASKTLHQTLAMSWTCSNHRRHSASISCIESPGSTIARSVRFDVGICAHGVQNPRTVQPSSSGPLWVEIEYLDEIRVPSASKSAPTEPDELENIGVTLSKYSRPFDVVQKELPPNNMAPRPSKRVRFSDTASQVEASQSSGQEAAVLPLEEMASSQRTRTVDLLRIGDFCEHFRNHCEVADSQHHCVGYLGGQCLQMFYLPSPNRRFAGESRSLAGILSWVSEHTITKTLPTLLTLSIAGSLAVLILQFHSTPWLPHAWRAEDVTFFTAGDSSVDREIRLSCLYFHADLADPSAVTEVAGAGIVGARNEILFRFGIVLLELGLSRPWPALREHGGSKLPPTRRSDYHIAEKLCAELTTRIGPRYSKVVRRCIGCDFSLSEPQDSLESEELQVVFLVNVVLVLQSLEKGIKALG